MYSMMVKSQASLLSSKEYKDQDKELTCLLETILTGPMFTETYFPPDDSFCFTWPCILISY